MSTPTHAYIGVWDGTCQEICVDLNDLRGTKEVAKAVADMIRTGGIVHRVTLETAREALFKPFPEV